VRKCILIIVVDDLDFRIRDVAFEAKVFNRFGTFDRIINRNMEYSGYEYLHCDLLDRVVLTIIILKMKLLHIDMHEQHL
jgi:hypothetical protein